MKKIYLTLLFTGLTILASYAQTPGELAVSVSTSETGGNFAPKISSPFGLKMLPVIFKKRCLLMHKLAKRT